jgi:hypothetical protein
MRKMNYIIADIVKIKHILIINLDGNMKKNVNPPLKI